MKYLSALLLLLPSLAVAADDMANIRGGRFRPLYLRADAPLVKVADFKLDKYPVTNAQFAAFVAANPQWQRGHVPESFAEKQYLQHWIRDGDHYVPRAEDANKPVVYVSWFAAHKYCHAQGKKLPDTMQWEYVARASEKRADGSSEKGYHQQILDWYAKTGQAPLRAVGGGRPNYWGVYDMHGLIWEWVEDFDNAGLLGNDSRGGGKVKEGMFCGSGAIGTADPGDYAAFMRYGFRSSLRARFTLGSLGFRCAAPIKATTTDKKHL